MIGTLNITENTLGYNDQGVTSNPKRKHVDWSIQRSYAVKNVKGDPFTVDPGATLAIFSGVRTTNIDNTTEFQLTASTIVGATNRYRFTWDGTGTAPAFRTDRALTTNTHTITLTSNPNQTLTMSSSTAGDFAATVVGDTIFLPDPSTGDPASVFSPLNTGYWVLLSRDGPGTVLQLGRPTGVAFTATTETQVVSDNSQVQAFSAAGVQVGDAVLISAGFAAVVQTTYTVQAVNPKWFEVLATASLPVVQTAVPGVNGIQFYTLGKRYVRIEVDQLAVVRFNADVSNNNIVAPWIPGDPENTGWQEKCGIVWALTVVNMTQLPMNLLVITAE